jgi:hypothetical protein
MDQRWTERLVPTNGQPLAVLSNGTVGAQVDCRDADQPDRYRRGARDLAVTR